MRIALIAAMSENGIIGANNKLPWHLPEELRYFKKVTVGKPIIMGHKTFVSLGSKPLPGRQNIILSSDTTLEYPGCHVVDSVSRAVEVAGDGEEIMVIGGAKIFDLFLPLASKIYLTIVHQECVGDTYFPKIDWTQWQKISEQKFKGFTTQIWAN